MEYEESLCSGCGQPRHESFDPASFVDRYEAEAMTCNACAARDRLADARKKNPDALHEGVYYAVIDRGEQ